MTTPIPPISTPAIRPTAPSQAGADRAAGTDGPQDGDFASAVGNALQTVARLENTVAEASRQAATGTLESVSDYMIAATEAQLATEITVAVRDRAVTAFNDIMRMQI